MTDPGDGPRAETRSEGGSGVRSTTRETEAGQLFTTHQRPDLRWFYRIDGKDSEKTYPTAGEAERGAMGALTAAAKARPESWKLWFIVAIALTPVAYVLYFLVRLITGR